MGEEKQTAVVKRESFLGRTRTSGYFAVTPIPNYDIPVRRSGVVQ